MTKDIDENGVRVTGGYRVKQMGTCCACSRPVPYLTVRAALTLPIYDLLLPGLKAARPFEVCSVIATSTLVDLLNTSHEL